MISHTVSKWNILLLVKRCPEINATIISNGKLLCNGANGTNVVGASCTLLCNKGYFSVNPITRVCSPAGSWTNDEIPFTCQGKVYMLKRLLSYAISYKQKVHVYYSLFNSNQVSIILALIIIFPIELQCERVNSQPFRTESIYVIIPHTRTKRPAVQSAMMDTKWMRWRKFNVEKTVCGLGNLPYAWVIFVFWVNLDMNNVHEIIVFWS